MAIIVIKIYEYECDICKKRVRETQELPELPKGWIEVDTQQRIDPSSATNYQTVQVKSQYCQKCQTGTG